MQRLGMGTRPPLQSSIRNDNDTRVLAAPRRSQGSEISLEQALQHHGLTRKDVLSHRPCVLGMVTQLVQQGPLLERHEIGGVPT